MNSPQSQHSGWELPARVVTRSGATFNPRQDQWSYVDENYDVRIRFDQLPPVTPTFLLSLKLILIRYAEELAPLTMYETFKRIKQMLIRLHRWKGGAIDLITDVDLINLKEQRFKGSERSSGAYQLSQLGGVFRWWSEMRLPGLSDEAIAFWNAVTLPSVKTGERVRTRCPINGPFTDIEQQGVIQAIDNLFAAGKISDSMYMATWLINALGIRPKQLAAMKVCDLRLEKDADGEDVFRLDVPRAKQPETLARDAMTERVLIRELGAPLFAYAKEVKRSFANLLEDPSQAPLFPATSGMADNKNGLFRYHASPIQFHYLLKTTWKKVNIKSERTGKRLNVHAQRFRYTYGTRMAQENCTLEQIAAGLDHSDIHSSEAYIASTPDIAIRLDEKVASKIVPLAQAFLGRVINDESEATRGSDPTSRIIDMRTDRRKPVGSCGTESGCGLLKPLACYGCSSFEPWLDGPHQQLAERLMKERERLSSQTGSRIASINDRTILAVLYVAQVCREELERRSVANG